MQMFRSVDPSECQHIRYGSRIKMGKVSGASEPEGRWSMQLELWCIDCNAQFAFVGLPSLDEGFELGQLPGLPRQSHDGRFMFCQVKPGPVPPHMKLSHMIPGGVLVSDTIWEEGDPDLCSRCNVEIKPDDPEPIRLWLPPDSKRMLTFCEPCTDVPRKDPDLPGLIEMN